jgi:preprotein translocase subunit YajC
MDLSCFGTATQGTTGTAAATGGTNWWSIALIVVMFVVIIAFMIIPQRRRQKKTKDMLNAMKPGDRVRTIGGLYGRVASIKEDLVILEVGPDKARMEYAKSAIAAVESPDAGSNAKTEAPPKKEKKKKDD